MSLPVVSKAYELDLEKIYEGYLYSELVVFAETRGKAKQIISGEIDVSDYKISLSKDEMTFLNMPVRRCKEYDKVLFKDRIMSRRDAKYKMLVEEENIKLRGYLEDKSITHCYITKRGAYYGWDYCGYTNYSTHAGVYSKKAAVDYCMNDLDVKCVPIDNDKHNDAIIKKMVRLSKGIISN